MNIVSSYDENEVDSFKRRHEEYYENYYYNIINDADFFNIYDGIYVDGDEIINCKKKIIEQWRM